MQASLHSAGRRRLALALSPELYSLYVRDRDWTPEQWEQWTYRTLRSQLHAD